MYANTTIALYTVYHVKAVQDDISAKTVYQYYTTINTPGPSPTSFPQVVRTCTVHALFA